MPLSVTRARACDTVCVCAGVCGPPSPKSGKNGVGASKGQVPTTPLPVAILQVKTRRRPGECRGDEPYNRRRALVQPELSRLL